MPMKRKNKAPRGLVSKDEKTPWFKNNVKRQRDRKKMQKQSRKKNR